MQNSRGLVVWPKENSFNKKAAHKDPAHVSCSGTWLLMKSCRKSGSQESTFKQSHMTFFSYLAHSTGASLVSRFSTRWLSINCLKKTQPDISHSLS
ncbi:hypothetical protein AVEN_236760-1 [Araneus ventricosus]|uniref:Uncharacterized protein n=1 Tax=Araneus ventricosus TaxID=182803 RepID=A0A4Y2V0L3_ARAVE|nr:hypothetical protein AVEN_236760-1 [Araneus ventricosus]